jgi:hypothetical protein
MRKVLHRGSPDTQSQTLMPDLPDEFFREDDSSDIGAKENASHLQFIFVSQAVFCRKLMEMFS